MTSKSTTERIARLILLLLYGPRTLEELQAELAISHDQLRRDLDAVQRAGWTLRERGRPKSAWIEAGPNTASPVTLTQYARHLRCAWLNRSDTEVQRQVYVFEHEHATELEPLWALWQKLPAVDPR